MSFLKKNEQMSFVKTSAKRECNKAVSAKQPTYAWVADKNALHGGRYQEVKDCVGVLPALAGAIAVLKAGGFPVWDNEVTVPDSLVGVADSNGDGVIGLTEAQRLLAASPWLTEGQPVGAASGSQVVPKGFFDAPEPEDGGGGSQVVPKDFFDAPEPTEDQKDGGGREWEDLFDDEPEGTGGFFGGERYDGKTFSEALPDRNKNPPELDVPARAKVRWTGGDDGDSEEEEEEEEEEEAASLRKYRELAGDLTAYFEIAKQRLAPLVSQHGAALKKFERVLEDLRQQTLKRVK